MTIGEKVSYIKGLAEGLKVDDSTNEGKILGAILDVLGDISAELDSVPKSCISSSVRFCDTCFSFLTFSNALTYICRVSFT